LRIQALRLAVENSLSTCSSRLIDPLLSPPSLQLWLHKLYRAAHHKKSAVRLHD
jgi:hypothetical protein